VKLEEGHKLIAQSLSLLNTDLVQEGDSRVSDMKKALVSLRLKDLEVDVTSTQLQLQSELSTLRAAIENGGFAPPVALPPAPPAAPQMSEKDVQKLKSLEADNKALTDQVKDLEAKLATANATISKASGNANAAAAAEIKTLKEEIESSKKELATKDTKLADASSALAALQAQHQSAQAKSASDSSATQALRGELDKATASVARLEAQLAAANKDWEAKLKAKSDELARAAEVKSKALQDLETRLEAEKEEMMEAMAQEIEVTANLDHQSLYLDTFSPTFFPCMFLLFFVFLQEIETTKAAEFEEIQKEVEAGKQRYAALVNVNKGLSERLRQLSSTAAALARDYRQHKARSKAELAEYGQQTLAQYKPLLLGKLKQAADDVALATTRYRKEMAERKKLHNIIQELKGNIRVYMRCVVLSVFIQ
jgi:kinesin family member C2/C3